LSCPYNLGQYRNSPAFSFTFQCILFFTAAATAAAAAAAGGALPVYTAADESIGSVTNLILEENGGIVAAVVGVGGFLGNFLMGFLPGLMVKDPKKWLPISIWSAISAVLCGVCIGGWQEIMQINKFFPMFLAICGSNIPVNVVLTPIAVKLLLPRVQKRGLYWKETEDVEA